MAEPAASGTTQPTVRSTAGRPQAARSRAPSDPAVPAGPPHLVRTPTHVHVYIGAPGASVAGGKLRAVLRGGQGHPGTGGSGMGHSNWPRPVGPGGPSPPRMSGTARPDRPRPRLVEPMDRTLSSAEWQSGLRCVAWLSTSRLWAERCQQLPAAAGPPSPPQARYSSRAPPLRTGPGDQAEALRHPIAGAAAGAQ